jgi:hypothetical protein
MFHVADVSRVIKRLEIDFEKRISRKTGWNKDELMFEHRLAFVAAVEAEVKNAPIQSMERPKCPTCGAEMAPNGQCWKSEKLRIVERTGRYSRSGSSGSLESNGNLDDFEMK